MAKYYVAVVNHDPYDSHAAKSLKQALKLANADRGAVIDIWMVQANDPGEARLPYAYKKGVKIRSLRKK